MDSGSCGKKSHLANNLFKTCFRSKDVALFFLKRGLGRLGFGNGLLPCKLSGIGEIPF